eukprot:CAMPEP_0184216002 /NCGR_PEP_ID=MMETSP0976-20121227/15450_1 /TAXON_ID=483370 /ORGANISM="non described non described, Strain CCMP2097" /LENGTH=343 /DNA_ID=CAMNT_0026520783 /DNA_START=1 /DNA_END=1029 /DNA_ORIENTATION=-
MLSMVYSVFASLYHVFGLALVLALSYVAFGGWREIVAGAKRFFGVDFDACGALEWRIAAWNGWRPAALEVTVRDVVLFTPASDAGDVHIEARTEEALRVGRVVFTLSAADDAVVGLRSELFDARVTYVTYEAAMTDTNVKRILAAMARVRRQRQQQRRDGVRRARKPDLLATVEAALATAKADGRLDVRAFDDVGLARQAFADASLLVASVLFELTDRGLETWAPIAEYGSEKAVDGVKRAALEEGWLSTEVRCLVESQRQRRWVATETVLVHDVRVTARLRSQTTRRAGSASPKPLGETSADDVCASYTTLSPTDATIDLLEINPAAFKTQVGLLLWLQQVV